MVDGHPDLVQRAKIIDTSSLDVLGQLEPISGGDLGEWISPLDVADAIGQIGPRGYVQNVVGLNGNPINIVPIVASDLAAVVDRDGDTIMLYRNGSTIKLRSKRFGEARSHLIHMTPDDDPIIYRDVVLRPGGTLRFTFSIERGGIGSRVSYVSCLSTLQGNAGRSLDCSVDVDIRHDADVVRLHSSAGVFLRATSRGALMESLSDSMRSKLADRTECTTELVYRAGLVHCVAGVPTNFADIDVCTGQLIYVSSEYTPFRKEWLVVQPLPRADEEMCDR
jgi:hypothetical protein